MSAIKLRPQHDTPENVIAAKTTSQKAPLEKLLTYLRIHKIRKFITGSVILDFGCGLHLSALRAVHSSTKKCLGIDSVFKGLPAGTSEDGIFYSGSFAEISEELEKDQARIDCVLSLACFEHLTQEELRGVLRHLDEICHSEAQIVGTVPTPKAKPVLEFLSYKLGLIDPTQIEDHKVYYNQFLLEAALATTKWRLTHYSVFQFGWNSMFVLRKKKK